MKLGLIVTAGGSGKRIGGLIPKQFHSINGIPILILTLKNMTNSLNFESIVVTYPKEHYKLVQEMLKKYEYDFVELVEGGEERFNSVWNALQSKQILQTDYVFIHDAVRPFVNKELVIRVYENLLRYDAVAPGIYIKDTLKKIDSQELIVETIDRTNIVAIQTPQGFRTELIHSAYKKALKDNKIFTDESAVVEYFGAKVKFVEGDERNIKITTPQDLFYANFLATT